MEESIEVIGAKHKQHKWIDKIISQRSDHTCNLCLYLLDEEAETVDIYNRQLYKLIRLEEYDGQRNFNDLSVFANEKMQRYHYM